MSNPHGIVRLTGSTISTAAAPALDNGDEKSAAPSPEPTTNNTIINRSPTELPIVYVGPTPLLHPIQLNNPDSISALTESNNIITAAETLSQQFKSQLNLSINTSIGLINSNIYNTTDIHQSINANTAASANNTVNTIESSSANLTALLSSINQREVGLSNSVWSLSSAKPGNGVLELRDNSFDSFWQSDGIAPHKLLIQFSRKQRLTAIAFYCDYKLDESYTPATVSIRSGQQENQTIELVNLNLIEPQGWVTVQLSSNNNPISNNNNSNSTVSADCIDIINSVPLRCNLLELCITASQQNGRDTHIRQVKLFGPRINTNNTANTAAANTANNQNQNQNNNIDLLDAIDLTTPYFNTIEFQQFAEIR